MSGFNPKAKLMDAHVPTSMPGRHLRGTVAVRHRFKRRPLLSLALFDMVSSQTGAATRPSGEGRPRPPHRRTGGRGVQAVDGALPSEGERVCAVPGRGGRIRAAREGEWMPVCLPDAIRSLSHEGSNYLASPVDGHKRRITPSAALRRPHIASMLIIAPTGQVANLPAVSRGMTPVPFGSVMSTIVRHGDDAYRTCSTSAAGEAHMPWLLESSISRPARLVTLGESPDGSLWSEVPAPRAIILAPRSHKVSWQGDHRSHRPRGRNAVPRWWADA